MHSRRKGLALWALCMCVLESITSFFPSRSTVFWRARKLRWAMILYAWNLLCVFLWNHLSLCAFFFKKDFSRHFWLECKKTRCLEITENVSFYIENEASYVYILSGQKLIKNAGLFWRIFENLKIAVKQCYQTDHL